MTQKNPAEISVILHDVRSLHNVGSVFRTGDAAGVNKIYLTGYTPAPFGKLGQPLAQVSKVALGAEGWLPWEKTGDINRLILRLKKDGYHIYAIEQSPKSVSLFSLPAKNKKIKIAFIFGNEVDGLSESVLKKCDKIVEIPMFGRKESLNVSVSVGVALFGFLILRSGR